MTHFRLVHTGSVNHEDYDAHTVELKLQRVRIKIRKHARPIKHKLSLQINSSTMIFIVLLCPKLQARYITKQNVLYNTVYDLKTNSVLCFMHISHYIESSFDATKTGM